MQPIMERMNALGIDVEKMARRLDRGAAFIERIAQGEIRFPPMEVVEGIAAELRWNVGEMIVEAGLYTKPLATLYWCNPEINTECGKRSCAYLHADGWCKRTKNPAFAVSGKDGSPNETERWERRRIVGETAQQNVSWNRKSDGDTVRSCHATERAAKIGADQKGGHNEKDDHNALLVRSREKHGMPQNHMRL